MASSTPTLLLLPLLGFLALFGVTAALGQSSESADPVCAHDWGVSNQGAVQVVEGDAGWLSCPLFSHPSVYNYSSNQNTGHNLVWYFTPQGRDLENPMKYSSRISKDRERVWLQPAVTADTGLYICMLLNNSSCNKIAMNLTVLPREEVVRGNSCQLPAVGPTRQEVIPLQEGKLLNCPGLQEATKMADGEPAVTWYHQTPESSRCERHPFWNTNRQQIGAGLQFHLMLLPYRGLYFCTVQYQRKGKTLNFTRSINVTAVYPSTVPKEPTILQPATGQVFAVKQDTEVHLVCRGLFPYLESGWDIWWTVDGKMLDKLSDHHRFSTINKQVDYDLGDRTEESVLVIKDFQFEDLSREFNCSLRNARGFRTRRAHLEEEVSLPTVELGCGFGVTLILMLFLFVVYQIFWLELLLLYRSWFGTDERHTDDKEYDVYISYARNSEEEQFVLSTLRTVLENELGYSVCIFDRDSLPGGTITDETLSFVARSRRVLVVVSPGYASRGSQALLELKAGIDGMARGGHLRVILVQYRPVQRQVWVRELRRARVALSLVRWQGDKSKELSSRFWKRLRVELPVRRVSDGGEEGDGKQGAFMRLLSQNSTNSQSGLISNTVKEPQKVLNYAG